MAEQQQKYLELQILEQQVQQVQQQAHAMQQQIIGLTNLTESLDEFAKLKPDTLMFSTLGSGVHIEATLKNTKQVIMNVGVGVSVRKTVPEAKQVLEKQIKDLQEVLETSQKSLQTLATRATALQTEIVAAKEDKKSGNTSQKHTDTI